ncbi:MAG: hypothetical protein KDA61_16700, partial [Planctomycetales bacterium]|nr:hypothetical protein [Planctomycetales bacterium]
LRHEAGKISGYVAPGQTSIGRASRKFVAKARRKPAGGRPPEDDPKEHKVYQAWKAGNYSSYKDVADAFGPPMTGRRVRKIVDKYRKRERRSSSDAEV